MIVTIAGMDFEKPERLFFGERLKINALLLASFGKEAGISFDEASTDDPVRRAEFTQKMEEWGVRKILDPEIFLPVADLIFKPAGHGVKFSVLANTVEMTEDEETEVMEAVVFFIRNASVKTKERAPLSNGSKTTTAAENPGII